MDLDIINLLESGKLINAHNEKECSNIFFTLYNEFKEHCITNDKKAIIEDYRLFEFLLEAENYEIWNHNNCILNFSNFSPSLLADKAFIYQIMKYCTNYPLNLLFINTGKMDKSLKEDNLFMKGLIDLNVFNYNFAVNKRDESIVNAVIDNISKKIKEGKKIKKYNEILRYLPKEIIAKDNEQLKTLATITPSRYFKLLDNSDKSDKKFILEIIDNCDDFAGNFNILNYIDSSILTYDFLSECMDLGLPFYKILKSKTVSDDLKDFDDLHLKAYKVNRDNLFYMKYDIVEKLALDAITHEPALLRFIIPSMKDYRKCVLKAIDQNPTSIFHAHGDVRDDEEIAIKCVSNKGNTLKYFSDRIKDMEEICSIGYDNDEKALEYCSNRVKKLLTEDK